MNRLVWLFVCMTSTAAFAANPSIAGKWDLTTSVAGNDGSATCSFTIKDTTLSGTCTGEDGDHPLTGKIDGSKVTWEYKMDYNGQPLTIVYSGTLAADNDFSGTIEVQPMGVTGDFSAKRKQ